MASTLIVKGLIDGLRTLKDRSIKLTIVTQELSPTSAAKLLGLQNSYVSLAIQDREITDKEIEILNNQRWEVDEFPNAKTPSQRLRAVMYKIWQGDNAGFEDFDLFYKSKMETIINHLKKQI